MSKEYSMSLANETTQDQEKSEEIRKKKDLTDKEKESNMKFKTGRWTDEEHELFLEGLRMYEKDWELI